MYQTPYIIIGIILVLMLLLLVMSLSKTEKLEGCTDCVKRFVECSKHGGDPQKINEQCVKGILCSEECSKCAESVGVV
jgi:hypothetical protein